MVLTVWFIFSSGYFIRILSLPSTIPLRHSFFHSQEDNGLKGFLVIVIRKSLFYFKNVFYRRLFISVGLVIYWHWEKYRDTTKKTTQQKDDRHNEQAAIYEHIASLRNQWEWPGNATIHKLTHCTPRNIHLHTDNEIKVTSANHFLSHNTSSHRQASATAIDKRFRSCRHWVWDMTLRPAIKEGIMVLNYTDIQAVV